jgi:hypothetical protein
MIKVRETEKWLDGFTMKAQITLIHAELKLIYTYM